jgi:hypothetical protein
MSRLKLKLLATVLLLFGVLFSCAKDQEVIRSIGDCKGGIVTDSLAMSTQLIGSWKWEEYTCSFCADQGPIKADKVVIANFGSNGYFSIIEESKTITEGQWQVLKYTSGYYIALETQGNRAYLAGTIGICNEVLIADDSPVDGPVNFFIRND